MNDSFSTIGLALRGASHIGVACHLRPDGDAIGSIVALARSLQLIGKKVTIFSEDGVPPNLTFLPHTETVIKSVGAPQGFDVAVALDNATKIRLGENTNLAFSDAKLLVNMDHHGTNPRYGQLNYIDTTSPATGQIIYDFLTTEGLPIDDVIRENIFAAISTDTGSFQYSSTNARTHRIVAEMMDAGLDTSELARKLYHTKPLRRLALLKAMLNEMKIDAGGKLAYWALSQKVQREVGVQGGDTEDLIDTLRMIEGVISAVMFEEMSDGKIRVSARSKDQRLNVSDVCAEFGGGGHPMAAGARLAGPLDEAVSRFVEVLKAEVQKIG